MKFVSVILVALMASVSFADGEAVQTNGIVIAKKGDVRKTIERRGTLIPVAATELSIWLEAFRGEMLVMEAREHGSMVNQGEVVLRLETRKIDEQIENAAADLEAAEMRLRHREMNDAMAVASAVEKLTASERDAERARIRLEGYARHEKAHRKERNELQRLTTTEGQKVRDRIRDVVTGSVKDKEFSVTNLGNAARKVMSAAYCKFGETVDDVLRQVFGIELARISERIGGPTSAQGENASRLASRAENRNKFEKVNRCKITWS